MKTDHLSKEIKAALDERRDLVKRPASGFLKFDYLIPGGPYEEQWDWDGFFIGMSLAQGQAAEAVHLKNWSLNYLTHVRADGFTPGLLTPAGADKRLHHMKPFLAQGSYFASKYLGDFSWLRNHWTALKQSVLYRDKHFTDHKTGLAQWYDSMESGADNNVALLEYPRRSVLAADLNTFLYREYMAMAKIASKLQLPQEAKWFTVKANSLKRAILLHLWDEQNSAFFNRHKHSGEFIRRLGYTSLIPLWGGIATKKQAISSIKTNFLNPKRLWSKHGLRTLSADDRDYNQKNIIKPHSNWQGPVWPLVNYLGMQALLHYGFVSHARKLAVKTVNLLLSDLKKTGGMHENYHAETGRPLAAPNFLSWNLLAMNMLGEVQAKRDRFAI